VLASLVSGCALPLGDQFETGQKDSSCFSVAQERVVDQLAVPVVSVDHYIFAGGTGSSWWMDVHTQHGRCAKQWFLFEAWTRCEVNAPAVIYFEAYQGGDRYLEIQEPGRHAIWADVRNVQCKAIH
jgi:hypothetical protein